MFRVFVIIAFDPVAGISMRRIHMIGSQRVTTEF